MRTRKSRRSESFWPSIVMRKWLNIKPKVHEFSEDEADTESSDDDDAMISYTIPFPGTVTSKNECRTQASETRVPLSRLRRRKSETLRVNYITNKDVRVMIGTWNVAGRLPLQDLELDEWLDTDQPADMYVLGFQEVVPLNAGNVLGAEDNRPIQEWEAIIRRTLNKSLQPKTLCKSYTAPPSPASISPSPSDPHTHTDGTQEEDQTEQTRLLKEFKLDWPEHSFDAPPPVLVSGKRLRRVLSSSARIGLEEAQVYAGLRRVCQSSGNLGMIWPEQQEASDVLDPIDDMSKPSSRYFRVVSKQMVGVYVSVWVCRRLRRHVNNLKVSPVGVGLMGYMGNKGSVSVSMTLFQTRLCFVCSHLTSGHTEADQQKRNSDVHDILHRTRFASLGAADHPQTIPSHDRIFWFGDLNYRLNMPDAEIRALVAGRFWDELMNSDQLSNELRGGHIFDGWKEGLIAFPPTYKYEMNSDRYVGEIAREGGKRRSPAWCDRILFLGKGIKQESYGRSEVNLSDHRPVSSVFLVEVEVLDQRKLERVLNFTNAGLLPEEI
ncbi:hypothetical protein OPV22_014612 [Ensete ventricosum]|uniref:Inositol polyphosphate-related phosphatase domain-containing protein n=1 Tax=Ensete ventricosum TaxID=4639 RepID=A0AAV8R6G2_ENSVE|nr:hypothetical protein OPV22_014612 [Ensete ventricosum]